MKVVLNICNLSDRPIRFLQIFVDKLSDGYNVKMVIKTLFMNRFYFFLAKIHDLVNLNIRKKCKYILLL